MMFVTLLGIVYGWLLWIITLVPIHKPITGLAVWNHPLGHFPALVSLGGHVVYGVVLGFMIGFSLIFDLQFLTVESSNRITFFVDTSAIEVADAVTDGASGSITLSYLPYRLGPCGCIEQLHYSHRVFTCGETILDNSFHQTQSMSNNLFSDSA